ncbi:MAG: hypothetical protein B7Y39_02685 [Bdellovibrio sp. 28-41-41]|nr:MAG: hypothetical protein B7Y39_02685 [Bdellovibrio sp. 28-41-41]
MSNYHDHLPILYDDIQDPVCVFEKSGDVHYCNEAFSTITGISVVRFLNRKVTVYNALKKLDGLDLNFSSVENFVQQSGIRICKYETKKNLRGLGQFSFKKFNYESSQQLYFLT